MKSSVPLKYQWIMFVTGKHILNIDSVVQLEIGEKVSWRKIMSIKFGLVNKSSK